MAAQNNEGSVATTALTEEDGNWRLEEISSRAEKRWKKSGSYWKQVFCHGWTNGQSLRRLGYT